MSVVRVALGDTGLRVLAGLALAEALVALLVNPGGNLPAPLGGAVVTWPLLSCLAPLGLVAVWTHPLGTLERVSARGPWAPTVLRLTAAAALILVATLAVAYAAPPDSQPVAGDGYAPWRNAALVSGLALAGAAWLPGLIAWLPSAGYVLACAAVGVPQYGTPYGWTLVFRSPRDEAALWTGCAILALGVTAALVTLRRPRLPATAAAPREERLTAATGLPRG